MNQNMAAFGDRLRQAREDRALSVSEIARITKIPGRTLERLEAGEVDELPGDVFVRGFLRSYARCVELDPDDTVRRYGEIATSRRRELEAAPAAPAVEETTPTPDTNILARALGDVGVGGRRMSLTLAVIILVIIATLTLSILLRRPSHVGDGMSSLPSELNAG